MQTRIIQVDPKRLKLLETNARYMRHEQYNRLVENVKRDGRLTSIPFAALWRYYTQEDPLPMDEDGGLVWEVLSGNHRVMAAIDAGLTEIDCMVTEDPLPKPQRVAIQLSHNAIAGEDDPAILKQLYQEIGEVDLKLYAGLDDKMLALLDESSRCR